MPYEVTRFECSICHNEDHKTRESALACEALGIPQYSFEVGEIFLDKNSDHTLEITRREIRLYVGGNQNRKHMAMYWLKIANGPTIQRGDTAMVKNLSRGSYIKQSK